MNGFFHKEDINNTVLRTVPQYHVLDDRCATSPT